MKTLYVSDLDGTLLQSDEALSPFTVSTINSLVERGMIFSYATARSVHTARKVTNGLTSDIPVIVYNGTMIVNKMNSDSCSYMLTNSFDKSIHKVITDLLSNGIYPLVYSFSEGRERFSYVKSKCSEGMKIFLDTRKNDVRDNPVSCEDQLFEGDIFYITCIDEYSRLQPMHEKYRTDYRCIFDKDIYSKRQWLEILPQNASKANAMLQLKEYLGCGRTVAFGDGKNDLDMFRAADEAYAVENACDELKAIADGIIGSNDHDGVAKWLYKHYKNME